ncbi:unnamed protein product [Brachionus calyciflorus]|uniref:Uncharacterized protein n=1 Tax=Brachionus calyciflorus TaxID=104777 RepID=A0A813Y9C6_9BILA|nr:unnamed protein product [Brachionus calyciflorus]
MSQNKFTLGTIHKSKNKRSVLPKAEVIQLYINNSAIGNKTKIKQVLPKFSNNEILNHINSNSAPQQINNLNETVDANPNDSNKTSTINKKSIKETKKINLVNSVLSEQDNGFDYTIKNKQNVLINLAREFFLDCKQRLDTKSFHILLTYLSDYDLKKVTYQNDEELKNLICKIYDLIKLDRNLCNKFSAFLISETALQFNLITEAIQHEKTYEFFQKLELMIPNKAAFKKLLQSIISLSNFSSEIDTTVSKIDYIKSKVKSVTKNNALINFDLDFLFDQRNANLEPVYEKISLVESREPKELRENDKEYRQQDEEYIDLTTSFTNNINKKSTKITKNKASKISKKN